MSDTIKSQLFDEGRNIRMDRIKRVLIWDIKKCLLDMRRIYKGELPHNIEKIPICRGRYFILNDEILGFVVSRHGVCEINYKDLSLMELVHIADHIHGLIESALGYRVVSRLMS